MFLGTVALNDQLMKQCGYFQLPNGQGPIGLLHTVSCCLIEMLWLLGICSKADLGLLFFRDWAIFNAY